MMIWEDSDFQQFFRQNHQKFIFKCNIFGGFTCSAPKKMIFSSVFIRENHVSHKRYDRDAKIAVFLKILGLVN